MVVEKAKGVDGITEGLSGALGNISKTLKDLMDKIMGPINKLLVDLGLKQKVETNDVVDKSKIDLKKLMENVKSDVEVNDSLSDKEKTILNGLLEKNKELKDILDRTKEEFGEDIKNRESQLFLSKLKTEADGGEIEEGELDEIIKTMNEYKRQIEEDKELKQIVIDIDGEHPIEDIIKAYDSIKQDKENGAKVLLNKTEVLLKIKTKE